MYISRRRGKFIGKNHVVDIYRILKPIVGADMSLRSMVDGLGSGNARNFMAQGLQNNQNG
jgi:hypothetical protein